MANPTTIEFGLPDARSYWNERLLPSYAAFLKHTTRDNAIKAASATWHLYEWLHKEVPSVDKDKFRQDLISRCLELGWLRDLTDGSKHRTLNTSDVQVVGLGGSEVKGEAVPGLPWQAEVILSCGLTIMLKDGTELDFASALRTAIEFWKREFASYLL
jgi:hypothetical protein